MRAVRSVHVAKSFDEARAWELEQYRSMSVEERRRVGDAGRHKDLDDVEHLENIMKRGRRR